MRAPSPLLVFGALCCAAGCASTTTTVPRVPERVPVPAGLVAAQHEIGLSLDRSGDAWTILVRDQISLEAPLAAGETGTVWLTPHARHIELELAGRPALHTERTTDHPALDVERALDFVAEASAATLVVRYRLELPTHAETPADTLWANLGGIHLPAAAAWYPRLVSAEPGFGLEVELPVGYIACSQGQRIELPSPGPTLHAERFESSRSTGAGLTLAVGPWERAERLVGDTRLELLVAPERSLAWRARALDALADGLTHLESWLGDYPFSRFTLTELPIRALRAYPGFALVDPAFLDQRGGRLGAVHELAHSWLGYSVRLGRGGNWLEGLTTYLVEHELTVRTSLVSGRAMRKRFLREHALAAVGLEDLPLTLVRTPKGTAAVRSLGYAKVAMIFHMLRMTVGEAAFFSGLRNLVATRAGLETTWDEVLLAFEDTTDKRLARFAVEWLERTGAPSLHLGDAAIVSVIGTTATTPHRVALDIEQDDPTYELRVPLEFELASGTTYATVVDVEATARTTVTVDVPERPRRVVVDPGYEVFRALNDDEIEPTLREALAAEQPWLAPAAPGDLAWLELGALESRTGPWFVETHPADRPGVLVGTLAMWPDEVGPGVELDGDRILLGGKRLGEGESLALATRAAGVPQVRILLADRAVLAPVLDGLHQLGAMSWVVFDPKGRPVRAGMWAITAHSMSRDL